jgi:hypothetical protein
MLPSSFSSPSDHSRAGIGRRVLICHGALRIDDRGTDQAQQGFMLGISVPTEECADINVSHVTAGRCIRLMPHKSRARRGIASKKPAIPVRAVIELSHLCGLGE